MFLATSYESVYFSLETFFSHPCLKNSLSAEIFVVLYVMCVRYVSVDFTLLYFFKYIVISEVYVEDCLVLISNNYFVSV